jgi:hypothetical protein
MLRIGGTASVAEKKKLSVSAESVSRKISKLLQRLPAGLFRGVNQFPMGIKTSLEDFVFQPLPRDPTKHLRRSDKSTINSRHDLIVAKNQAGVGNPKPLLHTKTSEGRAKQAQGCPASCVS